jgi:hypothetical protein
MANIRDPLAPYSRVDLTTAIRNIPIQWGTFNQLGIFTNESVTTDTVVFEESTADGALIVDRVRGERNNVSKDFTRKLHSFLVPHFPLDDYITPKDLVKKSAYDNFDEQENLQAVQERKLMRIRQNHDWTLNKARAQAIFSGTVYAPNGTVVQNWFSEFGVSQTSVDFVLGTTTTNILAKIETVIQTIHDNMGGNGVMTGIICPCDTTFFNALIAHPNVISAYTNYVAAQGADPLRGRLAQGGSPLPAGREFFFGGITFKEVRDAYNGTKIVTAGEGRALPTGSEYFKTYFAPAERFGLIGTAGETAYAFQKGDETKYTIETESNHVSAILRPQAIVRVFSSN